MDKKLEEALAKFNAAQSSAKENSKSVMARMSAGNDAALVMARARVGAQSGLGPGPGWGPYGPIGPLWAHKGPYGPIRARFWLKTNNFYEKIIRLLIRI